MLSRKNILRALLLVFLLGLFAYNAINKEDVPENEPDSLGYNHDKIVFCLSKGSITTSSLYIFKELDILI